MAVSLSDIRSFILAQLPTDGSTIGNRKLIGQLEEAYGADFSEESYWQVRDELVEDSLVGKGRGRGGSIYRLSSVSSEGSAASGDEDDGFALAPQEQQAKPKQAAMNLSAGTAKKAKPRRGATSEAKVVSYRHDEKRKNNPHVGMVDTSSDGVEEETTWRYDPHLDPELQFDSSAIRAQVESLIDDALASGDQGQMKAALEELKRLQEPYLQWTGKAERTSFDVDTVSLHVHERVDPATILAAVQKKLKSGKEGSAAFQADLFHAPFENLPLREAIDFYKHERDWANRLIAGDSLLVMNSMLQKEGMAGQVQMIYIDPPYGIKYGSNFQPFTNKRDVKDRKDEDLTQEPEMIKAFRDTWELGIHSYLTYLRDRLLLARELLSDSGSVFVQISDENVHHVREVMAEVFGEDAFVALVPFRKKLMPLGAKTLEQMADFIVWYCKDYNKIKYRHLYRETEPDSKGRWTGVIDETGHAQRFSKDQRESLKKGVPPKGIFGTISQWAPSFSSETVFDFNFKGELYSPSSGQCWVASREKMDRLSSANRLFVEKDSPRFVSPHADYPFAKITSPWNDTAPASGKSYVVQTNANVIERCMLLATDPGDLVLDPTCGSGTTSYVAEKWGRRWVTCDTSRVAVTLAKQRLMTASYDYFELKYPQEGLGGGFIYKTVPHITLKSIANNPEIDEIYEERHPPILEELDLLNEQLQKHNAPAFTVTEGGRKGDKVDFTAPDRKTIMLPSGEEVPTNALLEWEVPFDWPESWPEKAIHAFDNFDKQRIRMQRRMDESIANHAGQEVLYDQPEVSRDKLRITGPFTVEAVPFATVLGLDEAEQPKEADVAVARSGATSRHAHWREELLNAGIRGKGGQHLKLMDLEPLPGAKYLHAVGTVVETGERVAVSFGPEYAALEQRQVEIAKNEAGDLFPLPKLLVFCAFTFDPEAAKDIDSIKGIQAIKVQMNTDLLTEDLKSKSRHNESFWLMGQPDVEVHSLEDGKLQVEVHGFDYFDTKTGELKSGGKRDIAMWELDTDYDDRSLFPRQVFFPMAGKKDGWYKLKKDIRAELNEDLLDQFHDTKSLPFEPGDNHCLAVKIVDNRGIESLKVIRLD